MSRRSPLTIRYVGWARHYRNDLTRTWRQVTEPLPEKEARAELAAYRFGDGGKVALPEGEQPTLDEPEV